MNIKLFATKTIAPLQPHDFTGSKKTQSICGRMPAIEPSAENMAVMAQKINEVIEGYSLLNERILATSANIDEYIKKSLELAELSGLINEESRGSCATFKQQKTVEMKEEKRDFNPMFPNITAMVVDGFVDIFTHIRLFGVDGNAYVTEIRWQKEVATAAEAVECVVDFYNRTADKYGVSSVNKTIAELYQNPIRDGFSFSVYLDKK